MANKPQIKASRRYIPAEIKREVLIESGHSCAIPTCQHPATEFAHIVPFREVQEHKASNLIALCPNHHSQFDNAKSIDRASMFTYKQKLQFLNKRYTKYEMRILAALGEKLAVVANGEMMTMGLLKDGLIKNRDTLVSQNISIEDEAGNSLFEDNVVLYFKAVLTEKGKQFIRNWKSTSKSFESFL